MEIALFFIGISQKIIWLKSLLIAAALLAEAEAKKGLPSWASLSFLDC
jgi:hypothetical protein